MPRCYNYATINLALSASKKGISGCDLCGQLGLIIDDVPLEDAPSFLTVLEYAESIRTGSIPYLACGSTVIICLLDLIIILFNGDDVKLAGG